MNGQLIVSPSRMEPSSSANPPAPVLDQPRIPNQPQMQGALWADPQTVKSLNQVMELLVSTYLAANMNFGGIPLKEFMDSCERQILLASLQLTQGHQRNSAVLLGLKATSLFEKMRKHCINGRKLKLAPKLRGTRSLAGQ